MPEELYNWAKDYCKETKVFYSSKESYEETVFKLKPRLDKAKSIPGTLQYHAIIRIDESTLKLRKTSLARRVHTPRETDFRGYWRVNFLYLKMKPSAHFFVQWALFLEIWAISSEISSTSSKNDVFFIDCQVFMIRKRGRKIIKVGSKS